MISGESKKLWRRGLKLGAQEKTFEMFCGTIAESHFLFQNELTTGSVATVIFSPKQQLTVAGVDATLYLA